MIVLGACLAMSTQWLSYGLAQLSGGALSDADPRPRVGFVYSWSRLSGILTPFFVAFFLRELRCHGRVRVRRLVHGWW